ncbi:MAG: T9SS type A sorting domain-containing protein [Flavobacteriales bacterium]|nr:T9SS type A sorting domain-containing protein [Flavobacteriales bacterium]
MTKLTSILILFSSLLVWNVSLSQQVYFNSRYDFFSLAETASSTVVAGSNYLVIGGTRDTTTSDLQVAILTIDSIGNIVSKKSFGKSGLDYYHGLSGSLIKTFDGGFALGGSVDIGSVSNTMLWRFDKNMDTLWTKTYGTTVYSQIGYQCKQTQDKGFVIVGITDKSGDNNILLIKTDSLGNLEWDTTYGGSGIENGTYVNLCDDGGYIIGGNTTSFGMGEADTYILKTDSVGNVQWSKTFGSIYWDCVANVKQTSDGGYIIGTCLAQFILSGSYTQSKARIIKLDSAGSVEWDTLYGPARFLTGIINIYELQDGSFISVGQRTDNNGTPAGNGFSEGIVMKISAQGDSLWYRVYENLTGEFSQNYLLDIKPTTDGGIVSAGFVIPSDPSDTGTQDMWVMKLDSCGCAYAGCDSACQQLVGIEETPYQASLTLKIYPNPASSMATVSIPNNGEGTRPSYANASVGENYHLSIYDITGREVESYEVNHQPTLTINTQELGTGLYFLQLKQEGRMLGSGKLVVE